MVRGLLDRFGAVAEFVGLVLERVAAARVAFSVSASSAAAVFSIAFSVGRNESATFSSAWREQAASAASGEM